MRTIIFVLAIVFHAAPPMLAQEFAAGVKAGVNFARQRFEAGRFPSSFEGRTGFHAGAFAEMMVSDDLSVRAEPLYNSVGSRVAFGSAGDMVQKVDYMSLPLLLQYSPIGIFNVHAGPQIGFLLSARQKFDGDNDDITGAYRRLDFGIAAGAGVVLPSRIGIDARYVLGISNVHNTSDSRRLINSAFQLSLSYSLYVSREDSAVNLQSRE